MHPSTTVNRLMSPGSRALGLATLLATFMLAGATNHATGSSHDEGEAEEVRGPTTNALSSDLSMVGLKSGLVVHVDEPVIADGGRSATAFVPTEDGVLELNLIRHSVRDRAFVFVAERLGGELEFIEPTPVETYRGVVAGDPESIVAISILPDGLWGLVQHGDGERIWIEPIGQRVEGAAAGDHVIYRPDDVAPHDGVCGVSDDAKPRFPLAGETKYRMASGAFCSAQIAFDVDYPFYQSMNESLENIGRRIDLVLNTMNVQYNTQVAIDHKVTMVLVRTSEVDDPYQDGIICDNQIELVKAEWEGSFPFVLRDMVHLLTERNYGSVIGCHWVGVFCGGGWDENYAFGLSRINYSDNLSLSTNLIAHELGHGWGSGHCSCPYTMNPTNIPANDFNPDETIPTIVAYRNAWSDCLECSGEPTDACGAGNSTCYNTSLPAAAFCSDESCCTIVCAMDPFCCALEWDAACVEKALETCARCGEANSGNPYQANGTPGCSDFECCEAVCAIDAFCCSTEWDTFCAEKAITNCTNCGDDEAGSPYQQHDAGSDDRSCCDQVCSTDSFCCDIAWDAACVTTAVRLCAGCGDEEAGSPFLFNGTPGSDDAECCVAVCSNDPYCCEIEWDNSCAFIAVTRCYGWCRGDLDFDGKITGEDLTIMLANWGSKSNQLVDLDDDGTVAGQDLAILLGGWGVCAY